MRLGIWLTVGALCLWGCSEDTPAPGGGDAATDGAGGSSGADADADGTPEPDPGPEPEPDVPQLPDPGDDTTPDVPDAPHAPDAPDADDAADGGDVFDYTCDFFTAWGCCTPEGLVLWCDEEQVWEYDCSQDGLACGWVDDETGYDCVEPELSLDSGDPDYPWLCPGSTCEETCEGKDCGTACGVACGSCGEGTFCQDGGCVACTCDGKTCGDDGCGASCGDCAEGNYCSADGQCEACSCEGIACGPDPCGNDCGACGEGELCEAGACVVDCDHVNWGTGCCEGVTLRWCDEAGGYDEKPCKQSCGWDAENGWYDCGFEGEDPSGEWPAECGAAVVVPADPGPEPAPESAPEQADPDASETSETSEISETEDVPVEVGPDAGQPDTPETVEGDAGGFELTCENTPAEGCCAPDGSIYWCEEGEVWVFECELEGLGTCGWSPELGEYDCVDEPLESPDPSLPFMCPSP